MPYSPSRAAALALLCETALDCVLGDEEPYELRALRSRLSEDRESLQSHHKNPDLLYPSYLGLDGLFWKLCFSWADLQDYVEEANSKLINEERGFPDTPCRPRIHRRQTLADYALWSGSDEYPIYAWEEEDYEAATWPTEEEEDYEASTWPTEEEDEEARAENRHFREQLSGMGLGLNLI